MPFAAMKMKADAEIVNVRGQFTAKIDCADGTYIELLNKTPALTAEAAESAVHCFAGLVELDVSIRRRRKTPAMDAGRPAAFRDTTPDLIADQEKEQTKQATLRRIENIRRRRKNGKAFDKMLDRQMQRPS